MTTLTEALQRAFPLTRDVNSVGAKTSEVRLAVHVERERLDGYWVASCPELPGAASQGSTAAEAMNNLADAVDGIVRLNCASATVEFNFGPSPSRPRTATER